MRHHDIFVHDPRTRWLTWGALAPIMAVVFMMAGQILGFVLMRKLVPLDARGHPADVSGLFVLLVLPFAASLVMLLAWMRWVERRGLASIGLGGDAWWRSFARGHLLGMATLLGVLALLWAAGGLDVTGPPTAWSSPQAIGVALLLLPCFALQGSVEEILIRGWLMGVLARKFNLAVGVLGSSALFGLMHMNSAVPGLAVLSTFVVGLFLALWVVRRRSLLGAMGWHAGWNWLLAVGFDLPLSGIDANLKPLLIGLKATGPDWLSGGPQGPEGSLLSTGAIALAAAWLAWQRRRAAPDRPAEVSAV